MKMTAIKNAYVTFKSIILNKRIQSKERTFCKVLCVQNHAKLISSAWECLIRVKLSF